MLARMERLACDDVVAVCAIIFADGDRVGLHAFDGLPVNALDDIVDVEQFALCSRSL